MMFASGRLPLCAMMGALCGLGSAAETPALDEAERRCADLAPDALVALLGDERFVIRESAEARLHRLLHERCAEQPNGIERLCLRVYQTTGDPEVRLRVRAVLADYASTMWSPDAYLGVVTSDATEFGDDGKLLTWLEVTRLVPDGPAAKAGLRKGDRIVTVEREPFREGKAAAQLDACIGRKRAGDPLVLEIERQGTRGTVTVKLAFRPRSGQPSEGGTASPSSGECLRQYLKSVGG